MTTQRTPILESDISRMSHARVSIEPGRSAIIFMHRESKLAINLQSVLNPNRSVYIVDLVFVDCVFHERVDLGDYFCAGRVSFEGCQFMDDATFKSMENIVIKGGNSFRKSLSIEMDEGRAEIGGFSVDGELNINASVRKVTLSNINSRIDKQKLVMRSKCDEFQMTGCYFKRIYLFSTSANKPTISVHGCYAQRIVVSAKYQDTYFVLNESELGRISIGGPDIGKFSIKITHCKKIRELLLPISKINKVDVNYCEINKLQVWEDNEKGNILTLENCTIKQLIFWRVINEGLFSLRGLVIPVGGSISILSSNLGKTEFIHCDFSKATLEFEHGRLTETFLAETDFPREVVLRKEKNYTQAQLAFGQISTAFQKQGDTVRALEYQAREIEAHYKTLSWFPNGIKSFSFTKFSLWLNKCSNDFGRNWGRGLLFSFCLGLVLYYFLIISSKEFHIGWPSIDSRLISAFFKFMNPLRFFETENLFKFNGDKSYLTLALVSYGIDFIARIFVAYGYYQTIQAFRRYGRKS